MKARRYYPQALRNQAIELRFDARKPFAEIALTLRVPEATASAWCREYEADAKTYAARRAARNFLRDTVPGVDPDSEIF